MKKKVKKRKRATRRSAGPIKRVRPKKAIRGTVHVRARSPDVRRSLNRQVREISLNDEMLAKMILLWRYGIPNDRIARIIGIGIAAFKAWLKSNRPVDVVVVDDPDSKVHRKITIGLRDLMEHERENLKADYVQRLEEIIKMAKDGNDLKTASHNLRWMMEKMLPQIFGDPRFRTDGDPDEPKRIGFPLKPPNMN